MLATIALEEGRVAEAASMLKTSLRIHDRLGDFLDTAVDLARFAVVLARQGKGLTAARLLGSLGSARDEIGLRRAVVDELSEEALSIARAQVDAAALDDASEQGSDVDRAGSRDARPRVRVDSVRGVTRFVVDCETLLRIAAGEVEVAAGHQLVAPTLVRSQALAALYEASRRGEISAADGLERVTRINSLKVRFLGDKVLQRTAWRVADQLGWETTSDAEFVALTQLQADAFVTSDADLARAVSGLVETATVEALSKPG